MPRADKGAIKKVADTDRHRDDNVCAAGAVLFRCRWVEIHRCFSDLHEF